MAYVLALAITIFIFLYAGLPGLIVAGGMILLFDFMHRRVYGKSIAEIDARDYVSRRKRRH